jgi:hypothetical protein
MRKIKEELNLNINRVTMHIGPKYRICGFFVFHLRVLLSNKNRYFWCYDDDSANLDSANINTKLAALTVQTLEQQMLTVPTLTVYLNFMILLNYPYLTNFPLIQVFFPHLTLSLQGPLELCSPR